MFSASPFPLSYGGDALDGTHSLAPRKPPPNPKTKPVRPTKNTTPKTNTTCPTLHHNECYCPQRTHGRPATYNHGCRCPQCRQARATRQHTYRTHTPNVAPPVGQCA